GASKGEHRPEQSYHQAQNETREVTVNGRRWPAAEPTDSRSRGADQPSGRRLSPLAANNFLGPGCDSAFSHAGNGRATKSRRHGRAMSRAHRLARFTRALSVAMPVFAYICRYSFEINTN